MSVRGGIALLCALSVFPCAASAASPSLPGNYLPVPIVSQATDYSCGAAVLLGVLYYWRVYDGGEAALYKPLATTPEDGTEPPKLVEAAKSFGLDAELKVSQTAADLTAALQRGETAILDIQAWRNPDVEKKPWPETWDDGHYVVAVGIDAEYLYVMDPSAHGAYGHIRLDELPLRWHDYESRNGKIEKYLQSAVYIKGKTPLKKFPADLLPID